MGIGFSMVKLYKILELINCFFEVYCFVYVMMKRYLCYFKFLIIVINIKKLLCKIIFKIVIEKYFKKILVIIFLGWLY